MLDYGVTSELFRLLVAQGEIKPAVGAAGLTNKMPGERFCTAAHPGVVADAMGGDPAPAYELRKGAKRSPIRLVWTNLKQPAARYVASSLKLVE